MHGHHRPLAELHERSPRVRWPSIRSPGTHSPYPRPGLDPWSRWRGRRSPAHAVRASLEDRAAPPTAASPR